MSQVVVKLLRLFAASWLVVLVAGQASLQAQNISGQDSLLAAADSLLRAGKDRAALHAYQTALKAGDERAYRGLGELALRAENWGEAKDSFNRLLKSGLDDLAAHYGLGIAHRELGAEKAGILRVTEWDFSDSHFKAVIDADRSYRDVLYQYGLLERYRRHYFRAVNLGLEQLQLTPDSNDVLFGVFGLYDHLLEHQSPDTVEGWLLANDTPLNRYFLAELYRRHEHFERADTIFQQLLRQPLPFPKQPVLLSLARLHYELDNPLLADEYYWQAVREIDSDLAARFVFEDLKYILTDAELNEYNRATTPGQKKTFFRKFWEKRNPRPGSPDNARIAEHYRRLVFAEKQYRFDGFRLAVNNPDVSGYLRFPKTFELNDKFNDKGLIYLRYGEPDRRGTFLGEDVTHNESWMYASNMGGRRLMLHFEIDADGAPNNWRLVPVPTDDRIIESLEDWDPSFTRYLRGSRMTRDELLNQIAQRAREDVVVGLTNDRHLWKKGTVPIECPFQIVTFKGERGRTDLNLFYAIPRPVEGQATSPDTLWESGAAVYDYAWNKLASDRRIERVSWSDTSSVRDGARVGFHSFSLVPSRYRLGFYAEGLTSHRISGCKLALQLGDYNRDHLVCSDLLLAHQVVPKKGELCWSRRDFSALPNPSGRFRVGAPIFVYWEAYNLKPDNDGLSHYAVELAVEKLSGPVKRSVGNLFGLLGGGKGPAVITRTERTASDRDVVEFLAVDLSERGVGHYRIAVTVEDLVSGEKDTSSREFDLY